MTLEKGRKYAVKIEYFQADDGDSIKLLWRPPFPQNPLADALANARGADLVVAVVGITSRLEGEEMKVDLPGFKAAIAPAWICRNLRNPCLKRCKQSASRSSWC